MKLTRRKFLIGSTAAVGAGLVIGISTRKGPGAIPGTREGTFQPNAYLQITPGNDIIFQMARAEMGQGVFHGMTTIIAEELNVEPHMIQVELAGIHPEFALTLGQLTGGSMSTADSWTPLREAGAAARAMLIQAAADRWGIAIDQVDASDAVLTHKATGETLTYGDMVSAASALKGDDVSFELKPRDQYRFVGKPSIRNDAYIKSTGQAQFGMDIRIPDAKTAVVSRPGQFGASLSDWNAEQVRELPGVINAFEIESGIAVIADDYWQAKKAKERMQVKWQDGPLANLNSEDILQSFKDSLKNGKTNSVESQGNPSLALSEAENLIEAEYDTPFEHHSTMEPQNATALFDGDTLEIWAPTQGVDLTQKVAAYYSGLNPENIKVNATFMGGGFGRRTYMDFVGEVSAIAMRMPHIPIKLVWSREDDMQHDFYRPAAYHGLKGALDKDGKLLAWEHKIVSNSIMKAIAPELASNMLPDFVPVTVARSIGKTLGNFIESRDPTTTEGAVPPYSTPNLEISSVINNQGIPVGFWRSVGSSHTAFASEIFMDEMAAAAHSDPVEFRRMHLSSADAHHARFLQVLEMAVENSSWGQAPEGVYQGFAMHFSFESYVANVVEVSLTGKRYKVERVVSVADCGLAINPDNVIAQVQSSIIYGLSAAMKNPITIKNGGVVQSNFHDAPVLRMNEAPKMEVYVVDSEHEPKGIGEPGLPPVAPALSNALFAATGQRLRAMPLIIS